MYNEKVKRKEKRKKTERGRKDKTELYTADKVLQRDMRGAKGGRQEVEGYCEFTQLPIFSTLIILIIYNCVITLIIWGGGIGGGENPKPLL